MPHPLRIRDFRLLFLGRSLSTISDSLVPAALSLTIVLATGSEAALATVLLCALVPRLVLLPIGGAVADRFDPRRVALAADLTRCVTQLFVGLELLSGNPVLSHIAVAQVIAGVASACALPTTSPLVAGVVAGPLRQQANALMGMSRSVAWLFGPALAGLLILTAGPGWVFVLDATAFATSAALLAVIRITRVPVPHQSLRANLREGWTEVRSRNWYWISLLAHAAWNFAAGVLLTLGPVIAVRDLGGEQSWIAVLQAGGIGLFLGSALSSRARPRRPVLVANLGLASYAIPLVLLALTPATPVVVAGYGVALVALGFLNPTWETTVQAMIPEHALASVSAYDWLLSLAAQPLGVALAPVAAAVWGPGVPLVGAAVLVTVACFGAAASPAIRNLGPGNTVADTHPAATDPRGSATSTGHQHR